jgi:hypothetical protein
MIDQLAELAVERPTLEEMVELHLLQTTWGPKALLVASGHIARRLFAFRSRFRALEDDDIARHNC